MIAGVAARDRVRAGKYAKRYGIERVFEGYQGKFCVGLMLIVWDFVGCGGTARLWGLANAWSYLSYFG